MTRFAERLAGLLPAPLERRLPRLDRLGGQRPRAAPGARPTGQADVLVRARRLPRLDDCTDEVSTSTVDNPLGAGRRSSRGCIRVLSPDTYRGPIRAGEPDAGPSLRGVGAGVAIAALAAAGRAPAAFICEAVLRQRRRHRAPRRLSRRRPISARARRRRRLHRRRGTGRLTAAWARTSGASSSRASCPTSSRSRRRPGNGHPRGRGGHDGRDRGRARTGQEVLRVRRRQPGLVRDRRSRCST